MFPQLLAFRFQERPERKNVLIFSNYPNKQKIHTRNKKKRLYVHVRPLLKCVTFGNAEADCSQKYFDIMIFSFQCHLQRLLQVGKTKTTRFLLFSFVNCVLVLFPEPEQP